MTGGLSFNKETGDLPGADTPGTLAKSSRRKVLPSRPEEFLLFLEKKNPVEEKVSAKKYQRKLSTISKTQYRSQ